MQEEVRCCKCPNCNDCPDCVDFQKVAELKDAGLVIYRHTLRADNTVAKIEATSEIPDVDETNTKSEEDTNDVFILQNIKDVEITSADFMPEFERKQVSCQRCRELMARAQMFMGNVSVLDKNDVKAVCVHCKTKQVRGTCFVCNKIVKQFLDSRGKPTQESEKSRKRFQLFLGKMHNLLETHLESGVEQEMTKISVSDELLYNLSTKKQADLRLPNIDQFKRQSDGPLVVPVTAVLPSVSYDKEQSSVTEKKNKEKVKIQKTPEVIEELPAEPTDVKSLTSVELCQRGVSIDTEDGIMPLLLRRKQKELDQLKSEIKPTLTKLPQEQTKDFPTLRKYHSEESLITSFSAITEEILKKNLKYFFPQTKLKTKQQDTRQKAKKAVISSTELISETQNRLISDAEEKKKKQEEARQKKIEEEIKKRALEEKKKLQKMPKERPPRRVGESSSDELKNFATKLRKHGSESSTLESEYEFDKKTGKKIKKAKGYITSESEFEYDKKTGKKIKKGRRRSTSSSYLKEERKKKTNATRSTSSEEIFDDETKHKRPKKRFDEDEEKETKEKGKEGKHREDKHKVYGDESSKDKDEKDKTHKRKEDRGREDKTGKSYDERDKAEKHKGKEERDRGERAGKLKEDRDRPAQEKKGRDMEERVKGKEGRESEDKKIKEKAEREMVEKRKEGKATVGEKGTDDNDKGRKAQIDKEYGGKTGEMVAIGKEDKFDRSRVEKTDKEGGGKGKEIGVIGKEANKDRTDKETKIKADKEKADREAKVKADTKRADKEKAETVDIDRANKTDKERGVKRKESGGVEKEGKGTTVTSAQKGKDVGGTEKETRIEEGKEKEGSGMTQKSKATEDRESAEKRKEKGTATKVDTKAAGSKGAPGGSGKSATKSQTREADKSFRSKASKTSTLQKSEVDLLNKVLASQEKEKAEHEKTKQGRQVELKKAQEAAEKQLKSTAPAKSFKEAVATVKERPIESEKKAVDQQDQQKAPEKSPHLVDVKNITPLKSQDDLILKLVKVRKDEDVKMRVIPVMAELPDIPVKVKYRKKKSIVPDDISDIELDLESLLRKKKTSDEKDVDEIIIGTEICHKHAIQVKPPSEIMPALHKTAFTAEDDAHLQITQDKREPTKDDGTLKGIIKYALSDRTFIEKGWTMLPTEKVVRKMNVYRMRPSQPEFDWFEHNKNKGSMKYDTGEKLAEFYENGRGRWYYRNGKVALDYYDCEEINAQQRFIIYSSGEPDERGRSRPTTVLGMFDYNGNGVVFDHGGKIRLKYNQSEGVVLDREIGPVSHWKWHSLNDPPVLQQVMIDTHVAYKDPEIMKLGGPADDEIREDNEEMLAIEFDNFIKEKSKKSTQKFKPFQIKMKALKINDKFSLRVLDQASVHLIFRDGSTNLKLNLGMILDHHEIVDTDTADLGEVSNNLERLPGKTDSIMELQTFIANAKRNDRLRVEHDSRFNYAMPMASVDKLTGATSRPVRPLRTVPSNSSHTNGNNYKCRKTPANTLYYDTRIV